MSTPPDLHSAEVKPTPSPTVYGLCTHCGSIEVALTLPTGTRDLSGIGEHPAYPTGYGCEICS